MTVELPTPPLKKIKDAWKDQKEEFISAYEAADDGSGSISIGSPPVPGYVDTYAEAVEFLAGEPVNTGAPYISGDPIVGQLLTVHPGSWSGVSPIECTFQWQHDANGLLPIEDIVGDVGSEMEIQEDQFGNDIFCVVTATNSYGSASVRTDGVGTVVHPNVTLDNTAVPTLAGTAETGATLTCTPGTWVGDSPITVAHSWWYADDTEGTNLTLIADETGVTLVVPSAASHKFVTCHEAAVETTGDHESAALYSNYSGQIDGPPPPVGPTNTVPPAFVNTHVFAGSPPTEDEPNPTILRWGHGTWEGTGEIIYAQQIQIEDGSPFTLPLLYHDPRTDLTIWLDNVSFATHRIRVRITAADDTGTAPPVYTNILTILALT